jgi:hypothetical protein
VAYVDAEELAKCKKGDLIRATDEGFAILLNSSINHGDPAEMLIPVSLV